MVDVLLYGGMEESGLGMKTVENDRKNTDIGFGFVL
jgi:hypothetical protein